MSMSIRNTYPPKSNKTATYYIIETILVLFCGISLVLSLPLIPGALETPRTLDILGLACLLTLLTKIFRAKFSFTGCLYTLATAILFVTLLIYTSQTNDMKRLVILGRLVLSISTGITLATTCLKRDRVALLLFSVWLGSLIAVLIAMGQSLGISSLLALQPPDQVQSSALGILRPSAIWGHPNAAAQITMAGAACALALHERSGSKLIFSLLLFSAIPILNYISMQNRAPIIIGIVMIVAIPLMRKNIFSKSGATLLAALVLTTLYVSPQAVLGDRWTGNFSGMSSFDQGRERITSTLSGLDIAFTAPFGMPPDERNERMLLEAGVKASHNGFIFSALTIGPVITGLLLAPIVVALRKSRFVPLDRSYSHAIISILLMLLFEDALLDPSIVAILALLTCFIILTPAHKALAHPKTR